MVGIKKEPKDTTEIDTSGTQNQKQEDILSRIKDENKESSVREEKTKIVKKGISPKDVIVSGELNQYTCQQHDLYFNLIKAVSSLKYNWTCVDVLTSM